MSLPVTIDEVVDQLEAIIETSITTNDPKGYFAALYQQVTIQVKQGIADGFFEDGLRMEQLDVVFANRYLAAYYAYMEGQPCSASWAIAFQQTDQYWPVVMQHLLLGMNAHIALDLGIAAAEVGRDKPMDTLQRDFYAINTVLASLVDDVQQQLTKISPGLSWVLKRSGKLDDFLADFTMGTVRDEAWNLALVLATAPEETVSDLIEDRDRKVAKDARTLVDVGWLAKLFLKVLRLLERGTVSEKIQNLHANDVAA